MLAPYALLRYGTPYTPNWGVYGGKSIDLEPYFAYPINFSSDGKKLYANLGATRGMYQYALSTAWDITTATLEDETKKIPGGDFLLSTSGNYVFVISSSEIRRYPLSSAWEIDSAGSIDDTFTASFRPGIFFVSPDGTRMFCVQSGRAIYQYALSTAWKVSTATEIRYIDDLNTTFRGLFFSPDGKKMYLHILGENRIVQYALSTAWDISTHTKNSKSIKLMEDAEYGAFFDTSGTRLYVYNADNPHTVYQYETPPWPVD